MRSQSFWFLLAISVIKKKRQFVILKCLWLDSKKHSYKEDKAESWTYKISLCFMTMWAYLQLINNLVPLIYRKAGCCGHSIVLPESSAPRIQLLQVTLTELDQMRINTLNARPLHKKRQCFLSSYPYFQSGLCCDIVPIPFQNMTFYLSRLKIFSRYFTSVHFVM